MSGGEHNGHLPVGWDGNRPLDCVKCGKPWPCDDATDQVYGKLMSAREALCVAQMYVRPHWRNDVQEALDLIDEVGSASAPKQWSRFNQPTEDGRRHA